jgi:hypothetical protein
MEENLSSAARNGGQCGSTGLPEEDSALESACLTKSLSQRGDPLLIPQATGESGGKKLTAHPEAVVANPRPELPMIISLLKLDNRTV